MINKQELRSRLILNGLSLAAWARKHEHHVNTCHALFEGRLRLSGYAAKAIIADLKKDGYLTDEDLAA